MSFRAPVVERIRLGAKYAGPTGQSAEAVKIQTVRVVLVNASRLVRFPIFTALEHKPCRIIRIAIPDTFDQDFVFCSCRQVPTRRASGITGVFVRVKPAVCRAKGSFVCIACRNRIACLVIQIFGHPILVPDFYSGILAFVALVHKGTLHHLGRIIKVSRLL